MEQATRCCVCQCAEQAGFVTYLNTLQAQKLANDHKLQLESVNKFRQRSPKLWLWRRNVFVLGGFGRDHS